MSEEEVNYGRCTSDADVVSQVNWNDEHPTLFINLRRTQSGPGLFNCYNSFSLSEWLSDPDNIFAKWVAQPGKVLEPNGLRGQPDLNYLYVRLYTPQQTVFLEYDETVQAIAEGKIDYMIFDADYVGQIRIGDRSGVIARSGLHGQAPGEFIYRLVTPGTRVKGYGDVATRKARAVISHLKKGQEEPSFGAAVNLETVNVNDLTLNSKLYEDVTAYNSESHPGVEVQPQLIFSYENDEWTMRLEIYDEDGGVNQIYYPITQSQVERFLRNFIKSGTRLYDASDVTISA